MAVTFDAENDAVVCFQAVAVVYLLKRFDQDRVVVDVVVQHDVMIYAARTNRELAHVIRVELADRLNEHVKLSGLDCRDLTGDIRERLFGGLIGFCAARTLPGLRQVDF